MKTIGLIGGMSWESTALYYQIINREIGRRLGGLRSAMLHLTSLDFEQVVARQRAGAWDQLAAMLADAARGLEAAGRDCLLIGTNTMHRVADEVQAAVSIPLLHIADAAVAAIRDAGCRTVALLGTRYTMEQPFYVDHLARHGIGCVIPDEAGRAEVHRVIFDELCKGEFNAALARTPAAHRPAPGRRAAPRAWSWVARNSALTLSRRDVGLPLFDTTALHALAAVDFALGTTRATTAVAPRRGTTGPPWPHPLESECGPRVTCAAGP